MGDHWSSTLRLGTSSTRQYSLPSPTTTWAKSVLTVYLKEDDSVGVLNDCTGVGGKEVLHFLVFQRLELRGGVGAGDHGGDLLTAVGPVVCEIKQTSQIHVYIHWRVLKNLKYYAFLTKELLGVVNGISSNHFVHKYTLSRLFFLHCKFVYLKIIDNWRFRFFSDEEKVAQLLFVFQCQSNHESSCITEWSTIWVKERENKCFCKYK